MHQKESCLPETQRKCLPCGASSISINSKSLSFAGRNKTLCISSLRRDDITGERKRRIKTELWRQKLHKNRNGKGEERVTRNGKIQEMKKLERIDGQHWNLTAVGREVGMFPLVGTRESKWLRVKWVLTLQHTHTHTHNPLCSDQVWWSMLIFHNSTDFVRTCPGGTRNGAIKGQSLHHFTLL